MQNMESLSESVKAFGSFIGTSFDFAKKSPSLAKSSLLNAAYFLSNKTTQSTLFVLGFWLSLLDLLKTKYVEAFIVSILKMTNNIIQLLRLEETKILIANAMKLAASKPVESLLANLLVFISSLFHILRTKEIGQLRSRIHKILLYSTEVNQETKRDTDDSIENNDNDNDDDDDDDNIRKMNKKHSNKNKHLNKSWFPDLFNLSMFNGGENDIDFDEYLGYDQNDTIQYDDNLITKDEYNYDGDINTDKDNNDNKNNQNMDNYDSNNNNNSNDTLNQWVQLVCFIDKLELKQKLSKQNADILRESAIKQHQGLLILYQSYYKKNVKTFVKYALRICNPN